MAFPNYVGLDYGAAHDISAAKIGNLALGTLGMTPDGNIYRYCQAAATQIASGIFCGFVTNPVEESTVTVAHAIGTETVTVTASGVAADDYKDGYLAVNAGTGKGETHRIKSNTATSGGTIQVTFHAGDGLKIAWSISDTDVDIWKSPFSALVLCPTTGVLRAVVVTQGIITASYFFWGLAKGLGSVTIDQNGAAAGGELDEKRLVQSLNDAGFAFVDASPDATKILAGYRQLLGYLVGSSEDVGDSELELAHVDLL